MLKAAKALWAIGIFAFGLTFHSVAHGEGLGSEAEQEAVLTNFGLLRLTVEEAIEEVCDRLPLLKPHVLCLRSESDAPGNWLVERALIQSLLGRNFRVLVADTTGPPPKAACAGKAIFRYRVVDLELLYPSTRRKHLFGPRVVERKARLHLLLRLDAGDGEVLWTEEVKRTQGDWIPAKMLSFVERESPSFISPRLKTDGWDRLAGPALLSAVVGGLIYLFYTTQ